MLLGVSFCLGLVIVIHKGFIKSEKEFGVRPLGGFNRFKIVIW